MANPNPVAYVFEIECSSAYDIGIDDDEPFESIVLLTSDEYVAFKKAGRISTTDSSDDETDTEPDDDTCKDSTVKDTSVKEESKVDLKADLTDVNGICLIVRENGSVTWNSWVRVCSAHKVYKTLPFSLRLLQVWPCKRMVTRTLLQIDNWENISYF